MNKHAECPYCGCKGNKTPHKTLLDIDTAKKHGWRDKICGSCGRAFMSYI